MNLVCDAGSSRRLSALVEAWDDDESTGRLWARDAGLWTGSGEDQWLGWLEPGAGWSEEMSARCEQLADDTVETIVVLGMGGSSLGADLLVLGDRRAPLLPTIILDSIDPRQVARTLAAVDPGRAIFVVASKSGTTLETCVLADLFWQAAKSALGDAAGSRFVAVTDPGSELEALARELGWAASFAGVETIGGRYSVLSPFGLVPLALAGGDVEGLLKSAQGMALRCREAATRRNPGVVLGLMLAATHDEGRKVLAIREPSGLPGLGSWLEQLLAESTGKDGVGVLPVLHSASDPTVHLNVEWEPSGEAMAATLGLEGEPLGAEIFRWMVATAVLGSALGVDPFVQPGVEASKVRSRDLLEQRGDRLPESFRVKGSAPNGSAANDASADLESFGSGFEASTTLDEALAEFWKSLNPQGYLAVLAWTDRESPEARRIASIATRIQRHFGVATSLGFGPRYLHSTGQFFKAGPPSGSFLVLTQDAGPEVRAVDRDYDLETLELAQARGDFEVLAETGRPILLVHLGASIAGGLGRLESALERSFEALRID